MYWHIDTDIVALIIVCALTIYMEKIKPFSDAGKQNSSFRMCLHTGVVIITIDILSSLAMETAKNPVVYHALMTLYLIVQILGFVSWFIYSLTILYNNEPKKLKTAIVLVLIPYAIYVLLAISNPWTGVFYTLTADMVYTRAAGFLPVMVGLFGLYALALFILIFIRHRYIPKNYPWIVLAMTPVILAVSIPLQLMNSGWLLIMPAYMLCLVLAFLFFQNIRVQSDRALLLRFTEIVEHFASGMSICQIKQDGGLDIKYLSGGLANIYKTDSETLLSAMRQDVFYGVHPDDKNYVEKKLSEMAETRQPQEMTYRYITPEGEIRWIQLCAEATEHRNGTATVYATYNDLTELKKAEQLINIALKNTSVSIWEYDFSRRCIIQYQNSTDMHGFEEIVPDVPRSLVEDGFVHPDSAEAFLAMYDKLFAGEPFAEGVFKVQTSDRSGYWYEHIRYTNQLDEDGKPLRAVGMSTDETQQQDAIQKYEHELEKEKGLLTDEGLIVYGLFDLTTGETMDYRYMDDREASPEKRQTFAFGRENANLLIDPEERWKFLELNDSYTLLVSYENGEKEHKFEYRRRMPDGSVIWVRSVLHVIREPRSGHYLLFEYWYDIDEEKMKELMYRSIATDNYDFVARINGMTGRFVVYPKPRLTLHMPPLFGDNADEVTRQIYNDGAIDEDREMAIHNSLLATIRTNLEKSGRFQFVYREQDTKGAILYKQMTQYYIDKEREIIVMLREDITDIIRSEMQKNALLSTALESANQASEAKSQFLNRVSHELRTPLNAILGFLELAKGEREEKVREYLGNSETAAKQLLYIINDVLDVSSIEAGKVEMAKEPFCLDQVIRTLSEKYETLCAQKGLSFELNMELEENTWLVGDAVRISQILQNILGNALKFTESGFVRLSVSSYESKRNKVFIRFSVSDSGCGVSDELRARIFKPFEQESTVTAQLYGGSGLGLTIVSNLVNMMNGSIHMESVKGAGSTFVVELPLQRCKREDAAQAGGSVHIKPECESSVETLNFSGRRVLIAEDNPMNRMIVEMMVEKYGILHETAEDGKIALERFLASEPGYYDAILMDIQMPNMDGYEATNMIRNSGREDAKSIPIIAVTANALNEDIAKSLSAGMNAHVSKPINIEEFEKALAGAFCA